MTHSIRTSIRFFVLISAVCLLGLLAFAGTAAAINICGDGICQASGFPAETQTSCPADCGGYCGDGICSASINESCKTCMADCSSHCLSFTLPSDLKKSGCSGDDDNDCLDNANETNLAWAASPWYFYDEDESCSGAWYTDGPDTLHYGRRDYVQVRPVGYYVGTWASGLTGTSAHTVRVTYFLLHPHDCRWDGGFAGHQGDSEHVVFTFKSQGLRTWTLVEGEYNHHGDMDRFSGEYLKSRASEINTSYPSVAADQNSHGSWPGKVGSSSDCAGPEDDDWTFGTIDCFRGTMASAHANGYRDYPSASKNIGGPSPESFRASVVSVASGQAYTDLDVGHGTQREYWTPQGGSFGKFCGWECPLRTSSGSCWYIVHGELGCASPLSEKTDDTYFYVGSTSLVAAAVKAASRPEDPARTARLRLEALDLVDRIPLLSDGDAQALRARLNGAEDPLAELVPTLAGFPRERQLESLRWMLTLPEKKATALDRALLDPQSLTPVLMEEAAAELLDRLATALEDEGIELPAE